jgi:hypothetical protein
LYTVSKKRNFLLKTLENVLIQAFGILKSSIYTSDFGNTSPGLVLT